MAGGPGRRSSSPDRGCGSTDGARGSILSKTRCEHVGRRGGVAARGRGCGYRTSRRVVGARIGGWARPSQRWRAACGAGCGALRRLQSPGGRGGCGGGRHPACGGGSRRQPRASCGRRGRRDRCAAVLRRAHLAGAAAPAVGLLCGGSCGRTPERRGADGLRGSRGGGDAPAFLGVAVAGLEPARTDAGAGGASGGSGLPPGVGDDGTGVLVGEAARCAGGWGGAVSVSSAS